MVSSIVRSLCDYCFKKMGKSKDEEDNMTGLYRILVVCTGNVCRSPMVEGFLRTLANERGLDHVVIESAGTHALDNLTPMKFAVEAAAEHDIDIRDVRSTYLDRALVLEAHLILVMEHNHVEYIQTNWPKESAGKVKLMSSWHPDDPKDDEIKDPMGAKMPFYRRTAIHLKACCEGLLELL